MTIFKTIIASFLFQPLLVVEGTNYIYQACIGCFSKLAKEPNPCLNIRDNITDRLSEAFLQVYNDFGIVPSSNELEFEEPTNRKLQLKTTATKKKLTCRDLCATYPDCSAWCPKPTRRKLAVTKASDDFTAAGKDTANNGQHERELQPLTNWGAHYAFLYASYDVFSAILQDNGIVWLGNDEYLPPPDAQIDDNCISWLRNAECSARVDPAAVVTTDNCAKGFKPFDDRNELATAVLSYLEDPSNSTTVATTYGWPIGSWCVANVTHFDRLFSGLASANAMTFNEPLADWDVSNAVNMSGMFMLASSFNQDLSAWNVSQVQDMTEMFRGAEAFNQNMLGWTWEVARVVHMDAMFADATNFNGDVSNWVLSSLRSMSGMFSNAKSFNNENGIFGWDVSRVTSMVGVFAGATSFNQDLLIWNVARVTDLSFMFDGASSFDGTLARWNTSKVSSMIGMFQGAVSFNRNISGWDTSRVASMHSMFRGAASFNTDLSGWNVTSVTDMRSMFQNASAFDCNISGWDTSRVTSMNSMFNGAIKFDQDLCAWNNLIQTNASFHDTFLNAACPNQADYFFNKKSPLCHDCLAPPTQAPSLSLEPTQVPTLPPSLSYEPTQIPSLSHEPTQFPSLTIEPTQIPSLSLEPTQVPTLPLPPAGTSYVYQACIACYTPSFWAGPNACLNIRENITDRLSVAFLEVYNKFGIIPWSSALQIEEPTSRALQLQRTATKFITCRDLCDTTDGDRCLAWCPRTHGRVLEVVDAIDDFISWQTDANTGQRDRALVDLLTFQSTARKVFDDILEENGVVYLTDEILSGPVDSQLDYACIVWLMGAKCKARVAAVEADNCSKGARPFQNRDELAAAVLAYLSDPSNSTTVATTYGWPIGSWCVKNVTHFDGLFSGLASASAVTFNEPLGEWDVSNAVNMSGMFLFASSFNQDLSAWEVSQVQDMTEMFRGAEAFNQNMSGWDVGHVVHMDAMFANATKFNGDVSQWVLSSLRSMNGLFNNAKSFNGKIFSWNVSRVNSLARVFAGATSFHQDLLTWDVSHVTDLSFMFAGASSFDGNLSRWNTSKVFLMNGMFSGATSFSGNISGWDTSRVASMNSMFKGASSFNMDLAGWNLTSATDMRYMFQNASAFDQNLCAWGRYRVIKMKFSNIFKKTACPILSDPMYLLKGPFCHRCPLLVK